MFASYRYAFASIVSSVRNPYFRLRYRLLVSAALAAGMGLAAPAFGHHHKVANPVTAPATMGDKDQSPTTFDRSTSGLSEVTMVSVSPADPRVGEFLTITVRIHPPIPEDAPNITGGVLVRDPGSCAGVNLNAFAFRPGQTEATAAHYWVPPDMQDKTDRRIRVSLNPAFDDFYRIGQPSAITVAVQSPLAAGKVALPEPARDDILHANYPNPFNSATWIPYRLGTAGEVHLDIYNLLGQRVRTLVDQVQAVGTYHIRWDGLSEAGGEVASGTYIARLRHAGAVQLRRLLYVK